jgi:hypothetical protein
MLADISNSASRKAAVTGRQHEPATIDSMIRMPTGVDYKRERSNWVQTLVDSRFFAAADLSDRLFGKPTKIKTGIRTSKRMGFSTMPILWNGNSPNPDTLKLKFRSRGDAHVKAIVDAIKDEPGLMMWDILPPAGPSGKSFFWRLAIKGWSV